MTQLHSESTTISLGLRDAYVTAFKPNSFSTTIGNTYVFGFVVVVDTFLPMKDFVIWHKNDIFPNIMRTDSKFDSISFQLNGDQTATTRAGQNVGRYKYDRERKLGHRRVGDGGEITYKKIQSSHIMGSIQLGIQHTVSIRTSFESI